MTLTVQELTPEKEESWDRFVEEHPDGTLFHGLAWRNVLRDTFAHRFHYMLATSSDGSVEGVLPLVAIRSVFFGKSVISVPFGVYGGILAKTTAASEALAEASLTVARKAGAKYVELRHQVPAPGLQLPEADLHETFIAELPTTRDDVLGLIPRKARAEVRKAQKQDGISVDVGPLNLEEFHELFRLNKRRLGSPVFPKSLFLNLQRSLGEDCTILTVRHQGRPLTSVMNFRWKDTLMAYYSGASEDANRYSANNLMYAASMEWAVDQGLKKFDFGRSRKGTGAHAFKKNMGFEPIPLHYGYVLDGDTPMPEVNAANPKYALAQKVFRLLPGFLAEKLGSYVAKRMPV